MSKTEKLHPKKPELPAQRKVFDVMRPGKAPAASNSRGVVMAPKPYIKEDMFVPSPNVRSAAEHSESTDEAVATSAAKTKQPATKIARDQLPETDASALSDQKSGKATPPPPPIPQEGAPELHAEGDALHSERAQQQATKLTASPPDTVSEGRLTPEKIAVDTVVEQPPSLSVERDMPGDSYTSGSSMADDLLAETHAPSLDQTIISHHQHKTKVWEWIVIFFLIVIAALVALNFLLDAAVLTTDMDIPHTDLLTM